MFASIMQLRIAKGRQDERCSHGRPDPDPDEMEALLRKLSTQKGEATNNSESLGQLINLLGSSGVTLERSAIIPFALRREREAALKRSLFSAMLSLFVGVTIWEAKEPCMPLVAALFTVVTISLASVLQFISMISNNKPAFEVVALLSLNWFILGTLSYLVFPRVARISVPPSITFAHHVIRLFGGSTPS